MPKAQNAGDYIVLDGQQAAALFRLHVSQPLGACQYGLTLRPEDDQLGDR